MGHLLSLFVWGSGRKHTNDLVLWVLLLRIGIETCLLLILVSLWEVGTRVVSRSRWVNALHVLGTTDRPGASQSWACSSLVQFYCFATLHGHLWERISGRWYTSSLRIKAKISCTYRQTLAFLNYVIFSRHDARTFRLSDQICRCSSGASEHPRRWSDSSYSDVTGLLLRAILIYQVALF